MFNSVISLVKVTFVAIRVVIVCLSPVVVLERLDISSSALCFFGVHHYSKAMDTFYLDGDSHRSWLDVLKSVFEYILCF